uniref:nitronate monooxygenase n=1 Tax=Chamaesiphon sp. VAR_48_metabat_135_sub TaxID=2964699 RepID=UPI00286A9874
IAEITIVSNLPSLRIGQHLARHPIVQGAMAVRVSGANLAGAVANAGGLGLISSFGIGLNSPYFDTKPKRFFEANKLAGSPIINACPMRLFWNIAS